MKIELSKYEILALKYKDLYNLDKEICASQMNLNVDDFEILILNIRKKIYNAIINNYLIVVEEDKEKQIEYNVNSICKFRCGVCGTTYEINYKVDTIKCPLCSSLKIMKYK